MIEVGIVRDRKKKWRYAEHATPEATLEAIVLAPDSARLEGKHYIIRGVDDRFLPGGLLVAAKYRMFGLQLGEVPASGRHPVQEARARESRLDVLVKYSASSLAFKEQLRQADIETVQEAIARSIKYQYGSTTSGRHILDALLARLHELNPSRTPELPEGVADRLKELGQEDAPKASTRAKASNPKKGTAEARKQHIDWLKFTFPTDANFLKHLATADVSILEEALAAHRARAEDGNPMPYTADSIAAIEGRLRELQGDQAGQAPEPEPEEELSQYTVHRRLIENTSDSPQFEHALARATAETLERAIAECGGRVEWAGKDLMRARLDLLKLAAETETEPEPEPEAEAIAAEVEEQARVLATAYFEDREFLEVLDNAEEFVIERALAMIAQADGAPWANRNLLRERLSELRNAAEALIMPRELAILKDVPAGDGNFKQALKRANAPTLRRALEARRGQAGHKSRCNAIARWLATAESRS